MKSKLDLLANLNPAQQKAVTHTEGQMLVLAGAGSGKTRLLTHKVAYLIKIKEVNPYSIIAITFTNKAATEMKERVEQLVGSKLLKGMWISTFHSACNRILRKEANKLGYSRDFAIYDSRDSFQVIKDCLRQLKIDSEAYPPSGIRVEISKTKNKLLTPKEYANQANEDFNQVTANVYQLYQQILKDNQAMDFDDLIILTIKLFKKNPEVLNSYQRQFKYVLVDEYQDTNPAQYQLIRLLAGKNGNLTVVGDEDQSIYAFRMADIRNILEFELDFPNATLIKLEQNYRSTKKILEAANYVIDHNINRKGKTLWTANQEGNVVSCFPAETEVDEAMFVASEINRYLENNQTRHSDFAIFYRTHAQSRAIEEALIQARIPYRIVGSVRFYERKEIKDTLAYLWILLNPNDSLQLQRIINVPKRGIGQQTLVKILNYGLKNNLSLFQALNKIEEINVSARSKKAIGDFLTLYNQLSKLSEMASLVELINSIWTKTNYLALIKAERTPQAQARLENLQELISVARQYDTGAGKTDLATFLQEISLITPSDVSEGEQSGVSLMTLHSAKGLEFPIVFITGLEEGIFPHSRSLVDQWQLEEERRLCYVGMTRAKDQLYLTYAKSRVLWGQRLTNRPSRFIEEIPNRLLKRIERQVISKEVGLSKVYPGEVVYHPRWGNGLVIDVKGEGNQAIITVDFQSVGRKRLMLGYAPLELRQEQDNQMNF
jgi:DNA helicase-2/ATP-dependent DNA helicase PcrA